MRSVSWGARCVVTLGALGLCALLSQAPGTSQARAGSKTEKADLVAQGYEIFNREWMPNDPRGHGGDGLGPVYNDSSCVACHNSGGSGGAGPVSKNIDILNAASNIGNGLIVFASGNQATPAEPAPNPTPADPQERAFEKLADFHAGFRTSRTVVLHKFGTDPNYDAWRRAAMRGSDRTTFAPGADLEELVGPQQAVPMVVPDRGVLTVTNPVHPSGQSVMRTGASTVIVLASDAGAPQDSRAAARLAELQQAMAASNHGIRRPPFFVGSFRVSQSQRNPTPLFGLGLIDAIPESAIVAMAAREAKETPEIQGRASRTKDGRIGRLGWKGQTASAEDFVLNACAVELGLEVPGHHQATLPQAPKYQASGLDLTSEECSALTAYVRSLPRPVERAATTSGESKFLAAGRTLFANAGCASCHSPKLGNVEGIFSDLLLHDMGAQMGDDGSYSDSSEDGSDEPLVPRFGGVAAADATQKPVQQATPNDRRGATRQEWRTPPLWGFRDSGPYLHDGRAQTLEQAVAMHGGQGDASAHKFFALSPAERLQVEAFLKSLVAPPSVQLAQRDE